LILKFEFLSLKIYSKSLRFGFRDGSLDKKPKIKSETKKTIVVYTKTFKVNIENLIKLKIFTIKTLTVRQSKKIVC
jgi:hypothetical protein